MTAVRPDALPDYVRLAAELSDFDTDRVLDRLTFSAADKRSDWRLLRSRSAVLMAMLVLCTALLCAGLLRRADRINTAAMDTHAATASVAAATLGEPRGAEASLPPLVRLQTESRRLARTRSEGNPDSIPVARDITPDLIALLTAWPQDFPTRAQQIDIRGDAVTIRGAVRDTGDFERLKLALGAEMAGFEPPTGSANKAREGYTFNLVMRVLPQSPSPASSLADRGTP
ncbi:MAG: hypothetical protein R3B46_02035 [Phycisphaerales bacterium]|nr:hypothetical protein [Phycisphaerales bacterium]